MSEEQPTEPPKASEEGKEGESSTSKTTGKKSELEKPKEGKRNSPAKKDDDAENSPPSEGKSADPKAHASSPDRFEVEDITEQKDAEALAQEEIVKNSTPTTELEAALTKILARKQALIDRLVAENSKMKDFVRKRKQTYKRKRKDDGAPVRALSAYNMFIRERFAQLAKENEVALKSDDSNATLKRVPPASLVSKTGNEWKTLPEEVKKQYEEKAKADRERYEKEMAAYQPPDKQANRKRLKTGYNIFFTTHVLRLKQSESGVPSERGSVARLVGNAWKQLSNEEKMHYEREADKHNGMNPVVAPQDDEEEEDDTKQPAPPIEHQYPYPPPVHPEMHVHGTVPPPMHGQPDPRGHHYYPPPPPHLYGQNPYGHYDYGQHHHHRHQGRQPPYQYPGHHRHPYDL